MSEEGQDNRGRGVPEASHPVDPTFLQSPVRSLEQDVAQTAPARPTELTRPSDPWLYQEYPPPSLTPQVRMYNLDRLARCMYILRCLHASAQPYVRASGCS